MTLDVGTELTPVVKKIVLKGLPRPFWRKLSGPRESRNCGLLRRQITEIPL